MEDYNRIAMKTFMKSKIEKQPHNYTFVRCLFENDQDIFIDRYILHLSMLHNDLSECKRVIDNGGIVMREWRAIMRAISITLHHRYHLYRYDETGNIVFIESYGLPFRLPGHCTEETYIMNCAGKMARFNSAKLKND